MEDCSAGVEWGDEGELTFQTVVDKQDWPAKQPHNDSNSSDEDDEGFINSTIIPFLLHDIHLVSFTDSIILLSVTLAWDTTEPLSTGPKLPEVNPWDSVTAPPVVENVDWANFDNFENTPSANNTSPTVIIDNKLRDEMKKETPDAASDPSKTEAAAGSKTAADAIGAGDVKIEGPVDSASHIEADINHKSTDDSLYSACTADKSASPSCPSEVLYTR